MVYSSEKFRVIPGGLDQKTPEVGHIKDSLLVGTEEVKELLNTEDEAFYKLIKRLLGFIIIIIRCVSETKERGKKNRFFGRSLPNLFSHPPTPST